MRVVERALCAAHETLDVCHVAAPAWWLQLTKDNDTSEAALTFWEYRGQNGTFREWTMFLLGWRLGRGQQS